MIKKYFQTRKRLSNYFVYFILFSYLCMCMIREKLINEFITNHVFPLFREVEHPILSDKFFAIGPNDNHRVASISPIDNSLCVAPFTWVSVKGMFSLSEEETVMVLTRWFRKNVPPLSFDGIILLNYP